MKETFREDTKGSPWSRGAFPHVDDIEGPGFLYEYLREFCGRDLSSLSRHVYRRAGRQDVLKDNGDDAQGEDHGKGFCPVVIFVPWGISSLRANTPSSLSALRNEKKAAITSAAIRAEKCMLRSLGKVSTRFAGFRRSPG